MSKRDAAADTQPSSRRARVTLVVIGVALAIYALSDDPMYGGAPGFGWTQAVILGAGVLLVAVPLLRPRLSRRLALASISTLLTLGVAELVGEMLLAPVYRSCYQLDATLIFRLRSDCRSVSFRSEANGGDRIEHRINSAGFRGPELEDGGATRIVVYGDSFIHAFYCPDEETFPVRLEEELTTRRNRRFEVVNAGVSSFGPDQIYLKLKQDLPVLKPDLVCVAVFAGNDFGDPLRNKLFKLGEGGELLTNDPEISETVVHLFRLNERESILKRALAKLVTRLRGEKTVYSEASAMYPGLDPDVALMEHWLARAESEFQDYILDGNNIVTNPYEDLYTADISLRPRSASALYKVRLMEALLTRIRDTAQEAGVPLIFLFIPHPFNVCERYGVGRVDETRHPDYERRNLVGPLERWAEGAGAPFVSLFDVFRKQNAEELYFRHGNDHWNAAGQDLAAKVVAEYVLASGLVR